MPTISVEPRADRIGQPMRRERVEPVETPAPEPQIVPAPDRELVPAGPTREDDDEG
jgi:hypothetical protein